ncbi:MAG: ROK family protein [Chloroflexi bacterium]|nr:MAG: ROK family protein [Chloroflexota bacterium]
MDGSYGKAVMLHPQSFRRTGSQALVREINLATIMRHLHLHGPVSRASLAEMTGLNKTTVSSLVQELLEYGLLRETGLSTRGTGRPAVLLELNPDGGYFISAEIGVDFISIICANFAATILWRHRENISPRQEQQTILNRLLDLLDEAANLVRQKKGPLLGVALAAPGLVDRQTGTLLFAPNLKWRDVPLRELLQTRFDCPLFVENEANLAALGEYYFGPETGSRKLLYISAGVGLGGGLVQDGQLDRGASGFGSEFGHMTMDPEGEPCNCGNRGCWETQVSQSALFRDIRQAISAGQTSILTRMTGGNLDRLNVPLVVEAARAGDPVTLSALHRVGRYLGIGLASLVNALDPDRIVFGGILSLAADFLLPAMTAEIRQRALPYLRGSQPAQVAIARYGVDACVMGGVAVCHQLIVNQPAIVEAGIGD